MFKKISVATLLAHLKSKCVLDSSVTKAMVQAKLSIGDSDFLIETNTLKVSLLCPLVKCRIALPGRARQCKHVQCFDVESYLLMNEKKPTWVCPVCDGHTPYDTLVIDGMFKLILEKVKDVDEVQFAPDGEWSKVSNKSDKQSSSNKQENHQQSKRVENNFEEICFDETSPNTSVQASSSSTNSSQPPMSNGHSRQGVNIINRIEIYRDHLKFNMCVYCTGTRDIRNPRIYNL